MPSPERPGAIERTRRWFGDRLSTPVQAALRNTGWLLLMNIGVGGISSIVAVFMIRILGPAAYGQLAFAVSLIVMGLAAAELGLDRIVIRQIVEEEQEQGAVLGSAALARGVASTIGIAVVVPAAVVMRPGEHTIWLLTLVAAPAVYSTCFDVLGSWHTARLTSRTVAITRLGSQLVASGLRVVALLAGLPLVYFAALFALELLGAGIALLIRYQWSADHARWRARWTTIRKLLGESWPYAGSNLAVMTYLRIDQLMIGLYLGNKATGLYAAAAFITEVVNILPMATTQSVIPGLLRLKTANYERYLQRLQIFFDLITWIAIPVAMAVAVAGYFGLVLLFGDVYGDARWPLLVLCAGIAFTWHGIMLSPWVLAEQAQRAFLVGHVIASVTNVALNALLIPIVSLGITGAAIASVVAYGVAAYLVLAVVPKYRPVLKLVMKAYAAPVRYLWKHLRR